MGAKKIAVAISDALATAGRETVYSTNNPNVLTVIDKDGTLYTVIVHKKEDAE